MPYVVEVTDRPTSALEGPVSFTLGPFETREEAERIAERARATLGGSEAKVREERRQGEERRG